MQPHNGEFKLSHSQHETLSAICDTFLAQLSPEEEEQLHKKILGSGVVYEATPSQVKALAGYSASSLNVPSYAVDLLASTIDLKKRVDLVRVLNLLGTRPGSLLITGHFEPFSKLTRDKREKVVLNWKTSSLQAFRTMFTAFASLSLFNAYKVTNSPIGKSIGYDSANGDTFFENHANYNPVQHPRIPMMSTEEAISNKLEYDVIVVGSGAGGGVVAAELSSVGYSVLVIEKGKYYHQSEMGSEEEHAYQTMYDGGGSPFISESGSIHCLSGSTLGGGTALNYLVSLKPQHFVREEWSKQGLKHFISPQFEKDLDRVFERIGASTENSLNTKAAQKFDMGCKNLGYPIELVPVNTSGRAHYCSRCMYGCKSGIKNSTANTWLLDAMRKGAQFLDRTLVTRVLTTDRGRKATGVECFVHETQQVTTIKAKQVIISCGSLRTPSLLRQSGLSNPNIGRHLRLQPIVFNFGLYNEPINQNNGPLMTRVCNVSDNCQGDNYGVKIEEGPMLPGTLSTRIPWLSAAKHKEIMMRYKNMVTLLNVIRDKDSVGYIEYGDTPDARPVYHYELSKHDERSVVVGIEKTMNILVTSGARELYSSQANVEPFYFKENEASSIDNGRYIKWLETVRKAGILSASTALTSVHQLGSCRMGISPKWSAVQPSGATWEVKNLHVADGSLFPTAVGVNPMVTIEALALHVARNVVTSLSHNSSL